MADDTHHRITAGLSRVSLVLRQQLQKVAQEHELTPLQSQILVLLRRRPSGIRVGRLAEELAVTAATTSNAVSTLEAKALIRKVKGDPNEHRATTVELTRSGSRLAGELELWPDVLQPAIETLTSSEQAKLLESLIALIRGFEETQNVIPSRMCVSCEFFEAHRGGPSAQKPHYCHFIDAPIGRSDLRIDCPDHELASSEKRDSNWVALRGAPEN